MLFNPNGGLWSLKGKCGQYVGVKSKKKHNKNSKLTK